MARPIKKTVDYFPHQVGNGKTKLILQNEFGNDGYAFWFQLIELLCVSNNQVYDYNDPASWRLLLAETHVSSDLAIKILQLLADLNAIDSEQHKNNIIWCQNLVDNLELVYKRRATGTPEKPVNVSINPVNVNKSTQTIQYNTKLNKTKQEKENVKNNFITFWEAYPRKVAKVKAQASFEKINPDEKLLAIMIESIRRSNSSDEWQKSDGQYIPHPASWLNSRRWEDKEPVKQIKKSRFNDGYD